MFFLVFDVFDEAVFFGPRFGEGAVAVLPAWPIGVDRFAADPIGHAGFDLFDVFGYGFGFGDRG